MPSWDGRERRRRRLSAVGPYLAICAVVIVGFFIQGENSARIEREAKQRDHAICMDGNERSTAIVEYMAELGVVVPGIPPATARQLAESAAKKFAARDCPPKP